MALTLNGDDGISGVNGSASTPAIQGTDTNTGLTFGTDTVGVVTGGTTALTVDSSQRVGIGIASPTKQLHVSGTGQQSILLGSTDAGGALLLLDGDANGDGSGGDYAYLWHTTAGDLDIANGKSGVITFKGTSDAEKARIDSSGRLLVGTSSYSPTATAVLQGNSADSTGSAVLGLYRGTTSPASGDDLGIVVFGDSSNGDAAYFRCQRDGGTWNTSTSRPTRLVFSTTLNGAASPTNRLRIGNQGQHSLLSADYGLIVRSESAASGVIEAIYVARSATTLDNGQGVFAVYTNGSYATLSDQTQKKNIETTRDGYLEDLNRLRVVKYNWNEQEDDEPKELGLIAQEVEQVFPGLISEMSSVDGETEEETSTKSIKYSVLPVMLLKALQEADQKIEAQSSLIESQAATIAALDARLTALEGGTN